MRRIRVIIIAIMLAMIGAIIPMIAALWLAWTQALNLEKQSLMEYSSRMLLRANNTLNGVRNMFPVLHNLKINKICSDEHIKQMRELSLLKSEDELISYFEQGVERCNSYGLAPDVKASRQKADFTLPDGLQFVINAKPFINFPILMVALRKEGNYDIYVRPEQFSDIIVPKDIHLAIVYEGQIISGKNYPDPSFLKEILTDNNLEGFQKFNMTTGINEHIHPLNSISDNKIFKIDHNLVSISQYGPFFFIATEPTSQLYKQFKNNQLVLLPLGFITAFFIMGIVIYYSRKHLSFKNEILDALRNHEFIVHYQPIINTKTGECAGAEALVRWQRPDGQLIRPDLFIPFAEDSGLIPQITDDIIDTIFIEMEDFLVKNRSLHISINVASSDIQTGRILKVLETKFAKSNIARNQIWIELTERAFINAEGAKKTLKEARLSGHVILIDDFGTGYSSLSYLQELAVDILKIDKSFVNSLGMQSVTSSVTYHIINMARELNLQLVAEGVETKVQFDYLKEHKVDFIQGYIFSKPLTPEQFKEYCSAKSANTN